jgi:hypothetical protein
VKTEIENKYLKQKNFLLRGLRRAMIEEEVHLKEENHKKYKIYEAKYGSSRDYDIRSISTGRVNTNN